ncbi:hypothetical protein WA158_001241 [Blastocystis sp. Blastoise]
MPEKKNIMIVSSGALGSLIGAMLQTGSYNFPGDQFNVIIHTPWAAHYNAMKNNGLKVVPISDSAKEFWNKVTQCTPVTHNDEEYCVPVTVCNDDNVDQYYGKIDYAVILCKSLETEKCAYLAKSLLKEDGWAVTFQNGMGNVEILQEVLGENKVLQGSVAFNCFIKVPGQVYHPGTNYLMLAEQNEPHIQYWGEILQYVGIDTRISDNEVAGVLWSKLLLNAACNSLTSIYECKLGQLLHCHETIELMRKIVDEGLLVCSKLGVTLSSKDPFADIINVCHSNADGMTSMSVDIINKRKTEIDFINGYISKQGKKLGIPTPANDIVIQLIKGKEDMFDIPKITPY